MAASSHRATPNLHSSTAVDLLIITSIWCVISIVVNPVGNFPLNDDWAFGGTVRQLLETGGYRPSSWAAMPALTNVLWGALFCLPDGFSFNALRVSTLVGGLLGLIGMYILTRELSQPRCFAFLTVSILALNPIYFALSHTFMTDVVFTATMIWAAVFLTRSLNSSSGIQMLLGALLALAAVLSRQLALCIPMAFCAILLLRKITVTPRILLHAVTPLVLCVAGYFLLRRWLITTGRLSELFDAKAGEMLEVLRSGQFSKPFAHAFVILRYLGLFLLPILLFSLKELFYSRPVRTSICTAIGVIVLSFGAVTLESSGYTVLLPPSTQHTPGAQDIFGKKNTLLMPAPVPGNIIIDSGIGPLTLRDTFMERLDNVPAVPAAVWIPVTILSLLGATLLIVKLILYVLDVIPRLLKRDIGNTDAPRAFLFLCGIIYVSPLMLAYFFDRYLIPLIPFFAASIAAPSGRMTALFSTLGKTLRVAAVGILISFGLFAIGGTRDYLTWNRIRWNALKNLTNSEHVRATEIDGGFEFNGLYLYDPNYKYDSERSWWWVHQDTYQIRFAAAAGFDVIDQYSFYDWLPPHRQKIVVLRKSGDDGKR